MNATVYTIFREYLERTDQDHVAAASLTLADVMQSTLDARGVLPSAALSQPMTVPEVAKFLRVSPDKVQGAVVDSLRPAPRLQCRRAGKRPPQVPSEPRRFASLHAAAGCHTAGPERSAGWPSSDSADAGMAPPIKSQSWMWSFTAPTRQATLC
jgi:hypothetical protein